MKKVLAWAVVLALVLSSFTMAFAGQAKTSADFTDADQIQYTEAVDVMVATGVINGYPDGTFGPLKTVKRSEMAKMIAVMMNGGEDVGDTYKGSCPFADSKNHWAAGYIAYCASQHIIDGRSADVFDPEAEVTGTEVAKMALTSLGYDSKIQGYTGENWAANVLKDAKKVGLFEGLAKDFVPGNPCTREAAAQILFNCLKAYPVEYNFNMDVTTGDGSNVTVNSKPEEQDDPLYEEVFDGDLDQSFIRDKLGKPANKWTYERNKIGEYPFDADYTFTAEDEGFTKALEAYDEDLADSVATSEEQYSEEGGIYFAMFSLNGDAVNENEGTRQFIESEYYVGLGDTVELYEMGDGSGAYYVNVLQYMPLLITDVDTDVSDADAEDDITAYVSVQAADGESLYKDTFDDVEIAGFDAKTYVKDAVIAVAVNDDFEIIDSYVMEELASGEATKVSKQKGIVTIDGESYDLATRFNAVDGNFPAKGSEYTLYDYNDYALASVKAAEESDTLYGVVEAQKKAENPYAEGEYTYTLKMINEDGEEVELVVDVENFNAADYASADKNNQDDILVAYTLNEDGDIDSIKKATGTLDNAVMKTGGVIDRKKVDEDVVVFYYDADAEEYQILGYEDLESADGITGTYAVEDKNMVAVLVTAPLTETEAVFGFVKDFTMYDEGTEDASAEGTLFIDGKEVAFATIEGYDFAQYGFSAGDDLYKFTYDGDEICKVEYADVAEVSEPGTSFPEGKDGLYAYGYVYGKDGGDIDLAEGDDAVIQNIDGAKVYYVNSDGEITLSSASKVRTNCWIEFYQIDDSEAAWNIVVFGELGL